MARPASAPCAQAHLPEGCYAAPIGTIPVPTGQHEQLVALATNGQQAVERAVAAERAAQLQSRSDLMTALVEEHKASTSNLAGQLDDARAEVKDREERIRTLLGERHADVAKLGMLHERAITAENRDARILAEDHAGLRQSQLKALELQLNAELWGKGLEHVGRNLGPLMMAIRSHDTKAAPAPAGPVDTTIADSDPPPLCLAICQLAWRVRDPDLVQALATALQVLSTHPSLHALGAALAAEAPEAFTALVAVLAQVAPVAPAPAASGGQSTTTTSSAPA